MKNRKYDIAVFIGRFSPFHNGHLSVVKKSLELADKLIIIVGSDNKPIDWKNPFTTSERLSIIKGNLKDFPSDKIVYYSVEDRLYQNEEWKSEIYDIVDEVSKDCRLDNPKICITGFDKDESSAYLKSFPRWNFEEVIQDGLKTHNATRIRHLIYIDHLDEARCYLSDATIDFLENWMRTDSFKYVKDWWKFDIEYQKQFDSSPYPITFYCADNVVFQSGYVLMIRRKFHGGENLLALPGGFININESAFDASIRELKEETNIKVPEKILRASLFEQKLFDHPERSLRGRYGNKNGRTVSVSHCFVLDDSCPLPKISGNDDAKSAWWYTLAELKKMRNEIFEDHLDQILYFASRVGSYK